MTHLARWASTARPSPESVRDVEALDRYADELWRAKLPIATSVDATVLQLVWLTAGFSVTAERVAVGDYVCALQPVEIARRARLRTAEASAAIDELVGADLIEPLECGEGGYRLRPGDSRKCTASPRGKAF